MAIAAEHKKSNQATKAQNSPSAAASNTNQEQIKKRHRIDINCVHPTKTCNE